MIAENRPIPRPLILLAEAEVFRADYLHRAIQDAGMDPLGPVRSVHEGLALLANLRDRPAAAIVNLRLHDSSALPLIEEVARIGIALLLTGDAGMLVPQQYMGVPCLLTPYASYQVVDALRQLTSGYESSTSGSVAAEYIRLVWDTALRWRPMGTRPADHPAHTCSMPASLPPIGSRRRGASFLRSRRLGR